MGKCYDELLRVPKGLESKAAAGQALPLGSPPEREVRAPHSRTDRSHPNQDVALARGCERAT